VKEYAHLGGAIEAAVKAYSAEVRTRAFPSDANTYPMFDDGDEATKKSKMTGG
jgi:ketopantoate hydroxymethyltransferase